jgi:hypothetical protein
VLLEVSTVVKVVPSIEPSRVTVTPPGVPVVMVCHVKAAGNCPFGAAKEKVLQTPVVVADRQEIANPPPEMVCGISGEAQRSNTARRMNLFIDPPFA